MTRELSNHTLGTTDALGIPAIGGTHAPVLAFDALTDAQSVTLRPQADAPIRNWVLAMDVFIPANDTAYNALIQTGDGDAELFLHDGGIGTMGSYDGAVPFDTWARLAVMVSVEDGETVMRKYVDGTLAGTQNLGATDRWSIDPETGLRLFTDNDGETAAGYVSSLFFMADPPSQALVETILALQPTPSAGGFFPVSPAGGAIEVDFANESVRTRYGAADVILEGSGYRTPVSIGDSRIGNAAQFGIETPVRIFPC